MLRLTLSLALAAAALAGTAPASAAITTFANYSGVGGNNIYWQRTGSNFVATGTPAQVAASQAAALATAGGHLFTIATPASKTLGAAATQFTFLNTALYQLGPLAAAFYLDAVATPGSGARSAASYVYQPIVSGTFSFTYTGAADLHVGHQVFHTGANLLSATFAGGTISGQNGGTSGVVASSTTVPGETITYTSDFIAFDWIRDQDMAISLTSVTRSLGFTPNQALRSFASTTTGLFSADPLALVTAVPEPQGWALMVAGFGLVGLSRRRAGVNPIVAA